MEPFVKILYSECSDFKIQAGDTIPLGLANSMFEHQDVVCEEKHVVENVVYEIVYFVDNDTRTCMCSQNLGDGDGSVINHLRKNAIEVLGILKNPDVKDKRVNNKNPFFILQNSYENMLQHTLPELEIYCIAYKTHDLIESYGVDNCDLVLMSDTSSIIDFVKSSPGEFLDMLDKVIEKNPDNLGLIFSVEAVISKTEQWVQYVEHKDGDKDKIADILKEASKRATLINSKSVFYGVEPPEIDIQ